MTAGALAGAVLVTGNAGKLAEARRICGPELGAVELDLPEIQSLDLEEVLRAKADEAWLRLGRRLGKSPERPLVVEEAGLELAALGGFPGPLVKWLFDAVGADGIARLGESLGEPRVTARAALLYRDGDRIVVGRGATPGRLVRPPRGDRGFGWDPVFAPEGSARTFAEMAAEEKDAVSHRGRAWRDLLTQLG